MSVIPPQSGTADPRQMRQAMAAYVTEVHRAYAAQADLLPPAVRGRMPLFANGRFGVAAVGARNLHVLATREPLGPVKGVEVELSDAIGGLEWTLRFYDPVVLPPLGLVDESAGPAHREVRRVLGVATVLYHLVVQPGAGLTGHHALHVGTGLANAHSAAARDFDAIRRYAPGREDLVDELAGAAAAGLLRSQALLARELAAGDPTVAELAAAAPLDPDALRRAVLAALRARDVRGEEEGCAFPARSSEAATSGPT